jgi:hypothetical protein
LAKKFGMKDEGRKIEKEYLSSMYLKKREEEKEE